MLDYGGARTLTEPAAGPRSGAHWPGSDQTGPKTLSERDDNPLAFEWKTTRAGAPCRAKRTGRLVPLCALTMAGPSTERP